jgi:hypothetical protein
MSGKIKLSRLQSSERLLWSGVPVRMSRLADENVLSSLMSMQSMFLSRCPSSTTMYLKESDIRGRSDLYLQPEKGARDPDKGGVEKK